MQPIATDGVAWSVCLSVADTIMSSAKAAERIVFGMRTRVGPRNHTLAGVHIPTREGAIFVAKWAGPGHDRTFRWLIYSKRPSRGQNRYGVDADWSVLDSLHLANATEPSACCGDAALRQITLTTCIDCAQLIDTSTVRILFD